MRDRLVKLLQDNSYLDVLDEEHWLLAAEQLLANGVVVIDTDVVEVVRCKDCVHRFKDIDGDFCCDLDDCYAGDTGFCHYGKRRTTDENTQ